MSGSQSRVRGPEQSHLLTRDVSQESKQELHARVQRMHECSLEEMRLHCLALVRQEHLSEHAEESDDWKSATGDDDDEMDCEIDLRDEDDLFDEGSDRGDGLDEVAVRLDEDESSEARDDEAGPSFTLQVIDGRCRLVVPHWFRFRPTTAEGEQWIAAAEQRLESLERFARWLTDNRSKFLETADPWDLGVDALDELKNDTCSVTEKGLVKLVGADGSWNRHQRGAFLSWDDGSLPLSFFTSPEAKRSWAAQAFVQSCKSDRIHVSREILDGTKGITQPKGKAGKISIRNASLGGLDFRESIIRICMNSGATWDLVIEDYRLRILRSFE